MDVKDLAWNETLLKRFNNTLFPKSIRGLIVVSLLRVKELYF